MLFSHLFRGRPLGVRSRRRTRRILARHGRAFSPELLEARLPLAFNVTTTTLTSDDNGPLTFAYNITIDDQVDSSGLGRDIFLSRFDSGTPLIKVADNPSFNNATTLGILLGGAECTTIFVTSAGRQKALFATSDLPSTIPDAIPIDVLGNIATFNLADKTNPLLQGINPLAISGRGTLDYTNPDGDSFTLSFTYEAGGIPAYGLSALTFRQINADAWSDAGLALPTGSVSTSFIPPPGANDYVTTVSLEFETSSGDFGTIDTLDVINAPYDYFDSAPANPQSFTVSQGQNLNQRLIVDLAAAGSRISINSSWFGELGDCVGDKPGINVDPAFYCAYDGVLGEGQLNLFASEVVINQDVGSVNRGAFNRIAVGGPANVFTRSGNLDNTSNVVTGLSSVTNLVGGGRLFVTGPGIEPETTVVSVDPFTGSITLSKPPTLSQTNVSLTFIKPRPSGYIRDTGTLRVLANAQAPSFDIEVAGTQAEHGEIFVSQAGSLSGAGGGAAGAMAIAARFTDIRFEGKVSAASQGYFLSAPGATDQYVFTTRSASTGAQTGLISGSTVALTLGQPAGGNVDLNTSVNNLRFDSGVGSNGAPSRYTVTIEDADDLVVDSVAASSGPITLASATGKLSIKGAAVRTTGDLTATAATSLSFDGSVSSSNGDVTLISPALALGSSVTAGGGRGVLLQSKTGSSTINALVQAGGQLKAPVQAATTTNVDLAANMPLTIDGVEIKNPGQRVLVKNQTKASENGIYVVSSLGKLVRATDANTSALLVPGFITFAIEGDTQKGGWVFQNPATPILGQTGTGLSFVPLTATLAYDPVKAATTVPIDLATAGLADVDGVSLNEGDRVLVKDQDNTADNGIYLASVGPWVRASDADSVEELRAGSYVFVTTSVTTNTNGGRGFALRNDAVQVGTTDLSFGNFLVEETRINFWSPSNTLQPVRVATTVNLESLSRLQTIDGIQLRTDDRVLVKNQITPSANGIYVAKAGEWERAADVSPSTGVPYDTFVYVNEGTVGRGTGWLLDNSAVVTATLSANSNLLTGLRSTEGLTIGMAVEGIGIPAGSTITGVGADGTSVFLSQNAAITAQLSLVRFADFTNPTVGVTPLVFRAVGGNINVASASDISGSATQGRLVGQNVLLTAGTVGTGLINTKTTASTISAFAPGSISLNNASQVELKNVQSGTNADVVVLGAGTLTASSVAAGRNVSLSSTFGDVVAGRVSSTDGGITLSSLVSNTAIANATGTARVVAQNGGVIARADKGAVIVNGQVAAQGPGSDVSFISNFSSATASDPAALRFGPLADVAASDQLIIDTPNSMPAIDPLAKLTAARLSLRSRLFGTTAPPASLGAFPTVQINRTDAGNIIYSSPSSLIVEGATTVNGSITFSAPDLKVSGGIATVGANTDVTLTASSDNLRIDGTVTSQRDVLLNAVGGSVTSSSSSRTALITAPKNVVVTALDNATLLTKAQALNATLTGIGSTLNVQDDDGIVISSAILSGGGNATFKVGTPALGGGALVDFIDAGPAGTVSIDAFGDIVESTIDPAAADIVARSATLKSANGRIDLDTTVDVLTASTLQKTAPISIRDLGIGPTPLRLASITGVGNGADVTVTSARTLVAESVITAGRVNLTTVTPAAIQVGTVTATGNTATIQAGGKMEKLDGSLITATSVVLDSVSSTIDAMLAASNVAAATGAGGAISLADADALSIGNDLLARGISTTGPVTITVGGALTQTQSIVAQSLTAASTGGPISLTSVGNDVDSLTLTNDTPAVSFTDKDDLGITSIKGGAIKLAVGGNLTQTGPITGTSLAITSTAGNVTLANSANDVGSLAVTLTGATADRAITYTDANALGIGVGGVGITGGDVAVTTLTGTGITVDAPVVAGTTGSGDGNVLLKATAGNIAVAANLTAKDDTITLDASNGTITQTAGAIDCGVLVWYAKSQPTFLASPPNSFAVVGPNLTAPGSITINNTTPATLTVAGASTVDGDISITGKNIVITDLVKAGGTDKSVAITATTGGITFQSLGQIANNTGSGAIVSLAAAAGAIDAQNAATKTTVSAGGNLAITAKNDSSLSMAVTSVSGTVSAGNLDLTEADALSLEAASAQAIKLAVGGNLTQTGPITGTSLAITSTAGNVTLANSANDVGSLAVNNANRAVSFTARNGLTIAGLTGGALAMNVGGPLTQTGAITGTSLAIASSAGAITLTNANNDVETILLNNGIGAFSYADRNAVAVTAAGPLAIGPGGLVGTALSLTVGGDLTQTGAITGTSLAIIGFAGNVALTNSNNDVDSLSVNNSNRAVSFSDVDDLRLGGITGGAVSLTVRGRLTQNGVAIACTTLSINAPNQAVTLLNPFNDVATVNVSAGGDVFSFRDRNAVTIHSTGTLSVGTITAGTTATITTTGGGNVDIGPRPNGLLQSGSTLDLRGVQGNIILRNGGRIQAPTIQLPAGKGIQVGGPITSAAALNQAITTINSLPLIPGSPYEILVTSSFTLTQQLIVNRPIALRGTSQSVVLSGSAAVRSGLVLNSANGSSVRSLAFSGFADDAIRLDTTVNATISGVAIRNSGNGLTISGVATGTRIQGNVFDRNATGVRLLSATGALVGGSAAGQANTISNAQIGVFASGFCTGSQVVKNSVATTTTPYDVRGSRNLTLVQ